MAEPADAQHPATLAPPSTEAGFPYPENDLLAVVDDRETGERALAALRQAGIPADDAELLSGGRFLDRVNSLRERHRLLQAIGLSDERDIIQGYVEEAEKGHCLVVVHAADPDVVQRVRHVLQDNGAHDLHHWERHTITDLSDPA
jgi:hypothetical protein